MPRFFLSIPDIGDSGFEKMLKEAIERLDGNHLPLQRGMSIGGYAIADAFKAMIIHVAEEGDRLRVKAGIFYHGIIAGCSCADDPSPTDVTTEYCELLFDIERATGKATVTLADE